MFRSILVPLDGSSFAEQALPLAAATVLFVKPQVGPLRMTAYGGFRRIVVALDGSPRTEAAIEPATALASKQGAVIALVRVIPPDGRQLEERRIEARGYLVALGERLQRPGQQVQTAVLVGSNPASTLLT